MEIDIYTTDKKFKTIYIDPPWDAAGAGKIPRGAQRHYNLMKYKDIESMPVNRIAAENSHIYLWTTSVFIQQGFNLLKAWDFRYINIITWFKEKNFGLGCYFRGKTEFLLFGVKGKLLTKAKNIPNAIFTPRGRHSEKPEVIRSFIESASYPPYIEIFSRKHTDNWYVYGDQLPEKNTEVAV